MKFHYQPILDQMIALYKLPKTLDQRFANYLRLIQTPDGKELAKPLMYFNPMAKEHILSKLIGLDKLGFEEILTEVCVSNSNGGDVLQVYFNLADDVAGGWTTKDSTREQSFEIKPFLKRGFCVIVYFASEEITAELVRARAIEYIEFYKTFEFK